MIEMSFEQARHNMIEQQIRPWKVLSPRVLDTLEQVARDKFVPRGYENMAYADIEIPLGSGQIMLRPVVEAKILQELDIQPDDQVLEVGTGSGYLTACLANLGDQVTSIELHPEILDQAQEKLSAQGVSNIHLLNSELGKCKLSKGQFDAIAVTGSIPNYQNELRENLKVGGRLFVVTGEEPQMNAQLITRTGEESWSEETLFETSIPALVGFKPRKDFTF